ncbi:hypothetical protein [Roseateles chitinivorans]|uniref:hypothetical protein n=1 Tax=Roseateles chitinivorans TaxID=2917965 RepID=UPI003D67A3A1
MSRSTLAGAVFALATTLGAPVFAVSEPSPEARSKQSRESAFRMFETAFPYLPPHLVDPYRRWMAAERAKIGTSATSHLSLIGRHSSEFEWIDYTALGVRHWLSETPEGHVMCYSSGGKCVDVRPGQSAPPEAPMETAGAVCTEAQYNTPGSWCRLPKIEERHTHLTVEPQTANWRDIMTNPWSADDEPAVVVRLKMPEGRSLTLLSNVAFDRTILFGGRWLSSAPLGFEFGSKPRVHLGTNAFSTEGHWRAPRTDGIVTAAMKVTAGGNACFFVASDHTRHEGHFFASDTLIGNTLPLFDADDRPIKISASASLTPQVPTGSLIAWYANPGDDLKIEELLLVTARRVPDAGGPRGGKRKLSYAQGCDSRLSPPFN